MFSAPDVVTSTFRPSLTNGERMWSRNSGEIQQMALSTTSPSTPQMTSVKAKSKLDCGRLCMARLETWKLLGCSGFKYIAQVDSEDNCILYDD